MGNRMGSVIENRYATVIKVSGDTMKLRAPVHAAEILKKYSGYVLFESEELKKFGPQTRPVGFAEQLEAKKVYFLVDLPKPLEERTVMKRSIADSKLQQLMAASVPSPQGGGGGGGGGRRVTVRLSKEEYRKVMRDSKDGDEAAHKIMEIYAALNEQNCRGVNIREDAIKKQSIKRERKVRFLDEIEPKG